MKRDYINLLSEIYESSDKSTNCHVLYHDYDHHDLTEDKLSQLQEIVEKYSLSLHMIKTEHGYHFIDLHFFTIDEIQEIQEKFQEIFPSDYPTINSVVEMDNSQNQKFEGQTLRITKKSSNDLIYFKHVFPINKDILNLKIYSGGHRKMYELATEKFFDEFGSKISTLVGTCSYLEKIK